VEEGSAPEQKVDGRQGGRWGGQRPWWRLVGAGGGHGSQVSLTLLSPSRYGGILPQPIEADRPAGGGGWAEEPVMLWVDCKVVMARATGGSYEGLVRRRLLLCRLLAASPFYTGVPASPSTDSPGSPLLVDAVSDLQVLRSTPNQPILTIATEPCLTDGAPLRPSPNIDASSDQ
jgi:hypothetical protein